MKRIILVDGNSVMFRAYYATATGNKIMQNSKGVFTNAVFGFVKMIDHLLKKDYDNILVAFDAGKKTFRHEIKDDYKAGRKPMPDEFRMQIPYIKDYLDRMNIQHFEMELFEADDIIGTMAEMAVKEDYHVDVYSSDKDLLQLVSPKITVHLNKKGMTELDDYTPEFFHQVYELNYDQMVDLKALMGDPSDNLPGIKGVGQKSAVKLLQEYGTLENIIENKENIPGKLGENIREGFEDAIICKKMTIIKRDVPLTISLEDTAKKPLDPVKVKELFNFLEFRGLLKELNDQYEEKVVLETERKQDYKVIDNVYDLKECLLPDTSLYFETDLYNYHKANILAIGMANQKGIFIVKPELIDMSLDFQLFLSDENDKNVFDLKRIKVLLKRMGYDLKGVKYDMMLASYLLKPQIKNNDIAIVANQFDYFIKYSEEIYGKGVKFSVPEDEILYPYVASKVAAIRELKPKFIAKLMEYEQLDLLNKVEIPLAHVLAKMEVNGIKIDREEMEYRKDIYRKEIDELEQKIYQIVGYEFNIQSPLQLGQVLFEDLALPVVKKTKKGYSTDIDVLNYLKGKHEVIDYIIRYRSVTKLYQTYIEGLEATIYPDGKIHTIFEQALTVTGRLSSIEPNVQNFPSRSSEGKLIRKFFVPDGNNFLFSADYSQVELRVLAHIAKSKPLIEDFNEGKDVHAETAKKIFKVDVATDELRRRAKAVNFGIVYGISAFGLSEGTDLTPKEAQQFIDKYFELYPEIREYMDKTVEFAKEHGYVTTLLNRRRYIPEITSPVYMQREFGKRTAMNAPIQGSAADIIKLAMINIDKKMEALSLKSKMIFQIHDELVLEVLDEEKVIVEDLVTREMENAFKLDVALEVEFGFGKNLMEVH